MTPEPLGRRGVTRVLRVLACLSAMVGAAAAAEAPVALRYDPQTRGPVPMPAAERDLQRVIVQPWYTVSANGFSLEGPAFDRVGDLLFTDAGQRRVLRPTPDRHLTTVVPANALNLGGLAIHKDGRIFAAEPGGFKRGSIASVRPDGANLRTILSPDAGFVVNDLVLNPNGTPLGQILLPGWDEGHNLRSTSMALRPGTDDLLIVTHDGVGGQGSRIFHARVFAKALPLFSHQ